MKAKETLFIKSEHSAMRWEANALKLSAKANNAGLSSVDDDLTTEWNMLG